METLLWFCRGRDLATRTLIEMLNNKKPIYVGFLLFTSETQINARALLRGNLILLIL